MPVDEEEDKDGCCGGGDDVIDAFGSGSLRLIRRSSLDAREEESLVSSALGGGIIDYFLFWIGRKRMRGEAQLDRGKGRKRRNFFGRDSGTQHIRRIDGSTVI